MSWSFFTFPSLFYVPYIFSWSFFVFPILFYVSFIFSRSFFHFSHSFLCPIQFHFRSFICMVYLITVEALVSGHPRDAKGLSATGAGRLRKCKNTEFAVPDPDLEIRGPVIQTLRKRGGAVSKKIFFGPSGLSLV